MARNRDQRIGMIEACKKTVRKYPCVATYLTYIAAPYAAAALDMPGLAYYIPTKSATLALVADAAEGAGIFPTAARIVLGGIAVYNGINAIGDVQTGELLRAATEGWLAFVTFRDATVRHRTVE